MRARAGVGRGLGGPGVRHRALRERSRVPAILVRVPVSAVLFDLEIAFLFPWAVSLYTIGFVGFLSMMVFLIRQWRPIFTLSRMTLASISV